MGGVFGVKRGKKGRGREGEGLGDQFFGNAVELDLVGV